MVLEFSRLKTALMIIALVLGNTSPVHSFAITAAAVSAAASAVTAGTSLVSTTLSRLSDPNFSVTVAIQVENWTRYALFYPSLRIKRGAATVTPTAILPGKMEGFAVRKPAGLAEGVYGTVSWELAKADRRLVLMWSAPYNFNHYSNWMGLGLTKPGVTQVAKDDTWFDLMHDTNKIGCHDELCFNKQAYYKNNDQVIYRDEQFEIVGSMTDVHQAQIKVIIRPVDMNTKDLSPTILATFGACSESTE